MPARSATLVVVRDDRAAVAQAGQVLRGEEGERRGVAERAGRVPSSAAPAAWAASSTTGTPSSRSSAIGASVAEQVHRHDRLGARRERRRRRSRRVTQKVSGSMSQNTGAAPAHDRRLGGRVEGERRHHHLVAGAHAERPQRDRQGVGAVRHADAMPHPEVGARTPPRRPPPRGRGCSGPLRATRSIASLRRSW